MVFVAIRPDRVHRREKQELINVNLEFRRQH